jgi:integrase
VIEKRGKTYRVVARWNGMVHISSKVGPIKETAEKMERMLKDLHANGNKPVLEAIAYHEIELADVYTKWQEYGKAELTLELLGLGPQPEPEPELPRLGNLYEEWQQWLRVPGTVSPRTGRPYAPGTVERYAESWAAIFAALPDGRGTQLEGFTRQSLATFEADRTIEGIGGSTLNRDYTAVQSFFRWLADHHPELDARLPRRTKIKEPDDDAKSIPPAHLQLIRANLPDGWCDFFEVLEDSGVRISEGQFALRRDVLEGQLSIAANEHRTLKTPKARRVVPLTDRSQRILDAQLARAGRPTDLIWPEEYRSYDTAYRVLERACITAGLHDDGEAHAARLAAAVKHGKISEEAAAKMKRRRSALYWPHCFRHTYGFRLVDAGIGITVVRDLMGHSSVTVTERYTKARSQAQHFDAVRAALSTGR